MITCPICDEQFEDAGLHPHLRAHDKNELASVVVQIIKQSDGQTENSLSPSSTANQDPWHQTLTQTEKITNQRVKRDRTVRQHLNQLNQQINETLE